MSFKSILNVGAKWFYENYPKVAMVAGTVSVVVGVGLAINEAKKWIPEKEEFDNNMGYLRSYRPDDPQERNEYAKAVAAEYGHFAGRTVRIFSPALGFTLVGLGLQWFAFGVEEARRVAAVAAALATADKLSEYRMANILENGNEADERMELGRFKNSDGEIQSIYGVCHRAEPVDMLRISVRNDIPWDGRDESGMIDFLSVKQCALKTKLRISGDISVVDVARALGVNETRIAELKKAGGKSMGVCLTDSTRYTGETDIDFHCGLNGFDSYLLEEFRRGADLTIDIQPVYIDPFLGDIFRDVTGTTEVS